MYVIGRGHRLSGRAHAFAHRYATLTVQPVAGLSIVWRATIYSAVVISVLLV